MASDAQIVANRENGKLGGVKTEVGKAVVRFNARKHGILAQLISEYEQELYQNVLDQLFSNYEPQTWHEEMLVERIAVCYVQLYRAGKIENEHMRASLHPHVEETHDRWVGLGMPEELDPVKKERVVKVVREGYRPVLAVGHLWDLEKFFGYETRIESRMDKAILMLERLQSTRRNQDAISVTVADTDEIGFVSPN